MAVDIGHQMLVVVATLAVARAMLRAASLVAPRGLDRVLALITLMATTAGLSVLLLGLAGLGNSPIALATAALGVLALSRLLPTPEVGLKAELLALRRFVSSRRWVSIGGLVGALAAWIAWNVHAPSISPDGVYYHVPEIVRWAQDGHAGSVLSIHPLFPVGAYPLTHEVLLTWGVSLSRSLILVSACGPAFLALLGLSSWSAARRLGGSQVMAWLVVLAVCTLPLLISAQPDGSLNDLPGLAWLATAVTLAIGARARSALGFPALLAVALAAGAKTNIAPFAIVAAICALVAMLRQGTTLRVQAGLGAILALGTGGVWYIRNLMTHGSPVWPFASTPWGDPQPPAFRTYTSLLQDPSGTLHGRIGPYLTLASGAILLILGGLAAAVVGRSRATRLAGAAVPVGLFVWAASPTSGLSTFASLSAPVSQLRYLLPVIATAVLNLVLLARDRPTSELAVRATFGAVIAWNLGQDLVGRTAPAFPVKALAAGAVAGAVAFWLSRRFVRPERWAGSVALVAGAAGTVALLGVGVQNYDARLAAHDQTFDQQLAQYMSRQPGFVRSTSGVAMAPELSGTFVGYRLGHRLRLLSLPAPCAQLDSLRRRSWVIVRDDTASRQLLGYRIPTCLRKADHATVSVYWIYKPVLRSER